MVEESIIGAIRRYLAGLPALGINAKKAVLFGSFARGDSREWSDIDLIVIAPEFDRPRELEFVKRLWGARMETDYRIEPIPCGEREWVTDEGRPVLEIARQEGIIIDA